MTSREQFEASATGHYLLCERGLSRDEYEPEDYADSEVQVAWEFWKASREAVVVELPERAPNDDPYCGGPWDCGHNVALDECREAIEAAGIRVAP